MLKLVTAYRSRGHLAAQIDPLDLAGKLGESELAAIGLLARPEAPDLEPQFHGLDEADMDTEFSTGALAGPKRLSLRNLVARLKKTYAASIGAEFMHIPDATERRWVHEQLDRAGGEYNLSADEKKRILETLTQAEGLERYLHTRYVGQKRFSLEGGESLIPMLDGLIRRGGQNGVSNMVIGMAHRGRLNVLVNTLGKPPEQLFNEFEEKLGDVAPGYTGDVKYHMGFSADIQTSGDPVHVALAFNPSHLEIVNPVVGGSVRARQTRLKDSERRKVMPVLIHGDAALAGQGVVMEFFNMSQARGFALGGTMHIVINNQVGFTTSNPLDARSTLYSTDVAKMISAPVFHVNADDPEAVLFVMNLAFEYRQKFGRDVMIDLICYRRHGHNEADEPAATQPLMYQVIRAHKTTREMYAERLQAEGVITAEDAKAQANRYRDQLDAGTPIAQLGSPPAGAKPLDFTPYTVDTLATETETGVDRQTLDRLGTIVSTVPEGTQVHARVERIYADRAKMAAGEQAMDWGYAENLAYATLIDETYSLRIVGQDSGRGTFFHRHAVLHDQVSGQTALPLRHVRDDVDIEIIDSVLSEEAVLAFEYGYATAAPRALVIWEAQFGDFVNGAQVVIDQFISSGEAKWGRLCGMVMYLPHGYEGQGPEHSSARLERFLQLCALDNMQVCAPTTPAQMFHMLRRQMIRGCRKPLVVMTPKSLLRHKQAVSSLDELASGHFQLVIGDSNAAAPAATKRVVLCSGKVYYDLLAEAQKQAIDNVALVRVEQLYPFPREAVAAELARFGNASEVVWCQEEPMNQGPWFQIRHHLQSVVPASCSLSYAGRDRSPAPACGYLSMHLVEQAALVEQALTGKVGDDYSAD